MLDNNVLEAIYTDFNNNRLDTGEDMYVYMANLRTEAASEDPEDKFLIEILSNMGIEVNKYVYDDVNQIGAFISFNERANNKK